MFNKQLLAAIITVIIALPVCAQEKIETDRPDQTESPYTAPKKYFQFEFGFNIEKDKSEGVKRTTLIHPTTLLKYGLNENIELRAEFQSSTTRLRSGNAKDLSTSFEPLEIGFKTKLWEERGLIPKTSFIIHTTIPAIATKEFRQSKPAPNFRFTLQNTLSENWSLGYNAGMEWDGETTEPTYTYTLAPGFTINEKWAGYFEVFGFIKNSEAPEHSLDGGLYYFPNNNVKLDISAGYGISKVATDFYIALGISFRFKGQ